MLRNFKLLVYFESLTFWQIPTVPIHICSTQRDPPPGLQMWNLCSSVLEALWLLLVYALYYISYSFMTKVEFHNCLFMKLSPKFPSKLSLKLSSKLSQNCPERSIKTYFGFSNRRFHFGFSFTNPGVPLDFSCPALTQSFEVSYVICNFLDCIRDHHDTHVNQVSGGHFEHTAGELLTVPVNIKKNRLNYGQGSGDEVRFNGFLFSGY